MACLCSKVRRGSQVKASTKLMENWLRGWTSVSKARVPGRTYLNVTKHFEKQYPDDEDFPDKRELERAFNAGVKAARNFEGANG